MLYEHSSSNRDRPDGLLPLADHTEGWRAQIKHEQKQRENQGKSGNDSKGNLGALQGILGPDREGVVESSLRDMPPAQSSGLLQFVVR